MVFITMPPLLAFGIETLLLPVSLGGRVYTCGLLLPAGCPCPLPPRPLFCLGINKCFSFSLQMQTCPVRAQRLWKPDHTDLRSPQPESHPLSTALGETALQRFPAREKHSFPLSSWATTSSPGGKLQEGWT